MKKLEAKKLCEEKNGSCENEKRKKKKTEKRKKKKSSRPRRAGRNPEKKSFLGPPPRNAFENA